MKHQVVTERGFGLNKVGGFAHALGLRSSAAHLRVCHGSCCPFLGGDLGLGEAELCVGDGPGAVGGPGEGGLR